MNLMRLVTREISHRAFSFALSVFAVALASACVVASFGLLQAFDLRTNVIIAGREKEVKAQTDSLQETYRKIGTKMGFNVLILPKGQNLADLYANDFATEFMPEEYVEILAKSDIVTIQHLLPSIQQKLKWPERQRTVILIGTRGEVPLAYDRTPKKAILDPVPAGKIILGYELHKSMGIKTGQKVKLMGREFTVMACYGERGSKDDVTAWINLGVAQDLLGKKGLINGIMALECNCAMGKIGIIREEISKILPNTQVVEFASQALTRAESRRKAADYAMSALASEKKSRERLRMEKEGFFAMLLPVVVAVCALLIGILAFVNVRERREEVGVLRAVGWSGGRILLVFITRAVLAGIFGAVIGFAGGLLPPVLSTHGLPVINLIQIQVLLGVLIGAPALSVVASWLPALMAARQDPALVLRKD